MLRTRLSAPVEMMLMAGLEKITYVITYCQHLRSYFQRTGMLSNMLPFSRYLRLLPRSRSPIDDRKLHAAASFDSGASVVCCLALSRPLLPSLVGRGAVFVISVAQLDRPLRCGSRAREAISYLKDSLRFHTASYTFIF